MPVMTESDALPFPGYDPPDDPRRVMLADLVGRLAAAVAAGAAGYEAAAGWPRRAPGRARGARPRQARRGRRSDPAGADPGGGAPPRRPRPPPVTPVSWGATLGAIFQDERVLEGIARELAGLACGSAIRALAARLVAAASRDREEVRKLYLRYT